MPANPGWQPGFPTRFQLVRLANAALSKQQTVEFTDIVYSRPANIASITEVRVAYCFHPFVSWKEQSRLLEMIVQRK